MCIIANVSDFEWAFVPLEPGSGIYVFYKILLQFCPIDVAYQSISELPSPCRTDSEVEGETVVDQRLNIRFNQGKLVARVLLYTLTKNFAGGIKNLLFYGNI